MTSSDFDDVIDYVTPLKKSNFGSRFANFELKMSNFGFGNLLISDLTILMTSSNYNFDDVRV